MPLNSWLATSKTDPLDEAEEEDEELPLTTNSAQTKTMFSGNGGWAEHCAPSTMPMHQVASALGVTQTASGGGPADGLLGGLLGWYIFAQTRFARTPPFEAPLPLTQTLPVLPLDSHGWSPIG